MLAILLFALGFPAADGLLKSWDVFSLIFFRNVLGFGFLIILASIWLGPIRLLELPWFKGTVVGAIGFGTGSVMLLVAQSISNAITAALAAACMPIFAVLLEVLLDKRAMSMRFIFSIILVITGGGIATGMSPKEFNLSIGLAVGLLASAIFAWGSRTTVKSFPELSPLERTIITSLGMFLFCMLVWLFVFLEFPERIFIPFSIIENSLLLFIYCIVALAISQILWISAVADVGVGIASFHLNAAPFYVMIILYFLGSDWDWIQTFGVILLTIGTINAQLKNF